MTALFIYLVVALGFSFLCSIAEAVLLSVTVAYISLQDQQGKRGAKLLRQLKSDVDKPLAAILSLNTIAHTVGAAGVGAQAAYVFGNQYLGVVSAVLTLLILIFSEIIPKTLGSFYWRKLALPTAYALKYLIIVLYPLVWLSKNITTKITMHPTLEGFSREEFAAMADLGKKEGQLSVSETHILQNLFKLREVYVEAVMTPSTVMFSLPEKNTVELFFNKYDDKRFSRIPLYSNNSDHISGFVLRSDLLTAQARGNGSNLLSNYKREIFAIPNKLSLLTAFELFVKKHAQIMYVVDEYGVVKGVITLEDIFETLTGLEIVDEGDATDDMQAFARKQWRKRAQKMGIDIK